MVPEISVFLPNIPGQFRRVLEALKAENVNIQGFSVDLSGPYSQLRLLCDRPSHCKEALREWDYEISEAYVFVVSLPHEVGGLLLLAELLTKSDINIEYGYIVLGGPADQALIAIKAEKGKEAAGRRALEKGGLRDLERIPAPGEPID